MNLQQCPNVGHALKVSNGRQLAERAIAPIGCRGLYLSISPSRPVGLKSWPQRPFVNIVKLTRLALSPGLVLSAGLLGAFVWLVGLASFVGLTTRDTVLVSSAAVFGAVASTCGALVQSHRARATAGVLARAEHEATHDSLTDLPNRSAMFDRLEESLVAAAENDTVVGVLFLDLDRFKVINDSMGHEAGDELLRIVAGRLTSAVRGSDIVARFGGDEFVVVVRELLNERSVLAVAEQILRSFEQKFSLFGGSHVIAASIGVAIARPGDDRRPVDLVRDADVAMYKAKRARSGYAVFDEMQRLHVIDRLDIERDLIDAIDEEQFTVFYQPLVDVGKRQLFGFEALVRWNHPVRGLIGPAEFLNVAEEAGMMARIGETVLREATAQAAVWNHLNPNARSVKMSVNLAEQQLIDGDFPDLVNDVLHWSGLPPEQLVLEITEDVISDHLDGMGVVNRLRDLGVSLAIDDFGTGRSSLSYVKQFDMVSTLKIDRTFTDLDPSGSNQAIVQAVVAMSKGLNLEVVAEGVETIEQVEYLQGLGISIMQGYLFNAPLPAAGIDPAAWFVPSAAPAVSQEGLSQLEVSRGLALNVDQKRPDLIQNRPARRG